MQDRTRSSIQTIYERLFNIEQSLAKVRDAALSDRLFPSADTIEVPGRSLAWKVFLVPSEPLTASIINPQSLLSSLRDSRQYYLAELTEIMKAPDGSYPEDFLPGSSPLPRRATSAQENLETNNPLSLHVENPWTEWFASMELRKTIQQDVERTFPDIEFFRNPDVQTQLTNILFLHSSKNTSIGYRQGMHELLASLYFAVNHDSISYSTSNQQDDILGELCAASWVAADAWVLFGVVMSGVAKWYEWQEPPPNPLSSPLSHQVHVSARTGRIEVKPYIAPIVQACNYIQSTLLKNADSLLWRQMQSAGIEPQIYGIRWLRLLFTRELPLPDAMKLWDGLFASDSTLELAPWICVAMLIRIRNQLIPSDYTGQLTVLLHYPSIHQTEEPPHHASLLVRQALALQMSGNSATGNSLILENRNLLGIPMEIPDPPTVPHKRPVQGVRGHRPQSISAAQAHANHASGPQVGFPEYIARGLLERGESLGINKTLLNAVSELKRNIPDLAASFATVRSPTSPYASVPLTSDYSSADRPPWEPRSRLDMESEISDMKTRSEKLGSSLSWIVDILLREENSASDSQYKKEKQEAIESLAYVRDTLMAGLPQVDEDRLFSDSERYRRKCEEQARVRGLQAEIAKPSPVSQSSLSNALRASTGRSRPSFDKKAFHDINIKPSPNSAPSNHTRIAPWNYTTSNFSDSQSDLPITQLPKRPPPTSHGASRISSVHYALPDDPDTPRQASSSLHDPLGVL